MMRKLIFLLILLLAAACTSQTPSPTSGPPPVEQPAESPTIPAGSPETATQAGTPTQAPPTETAGPTPFPTTTSVPDSPPSEDAPLVFAIIGDYGFAGPDEAAVAELVKSWRPEFILTTGDNNYPDGAAETIDANIGQYYHEFIGGYQGKYGEGADTNRFFPTMGNHDWHQPDASVHTGYFDLPGNERYYDFVWGPVHFFAIDSDGDEPDGVGRSSIQAMWLQEQLAASTSPWKIVYMHHPPFSSARHGNTAWMNWPFQEWGATAVIAGHDHVYERLVRDGFPYITNGLGGYPARYGFTIPRRGSEVRFNADYGAMRVEATPTRLNFQFITVGNALVDEYTLEQAPAETTAPQPVTAFPDPAGYAWALLEDGYERPLALVNAGDGTGRLFVVEQGGMIRIIGRETPFLDIRDLVNDGANEQGLLGLAFHPDYADNGYFYVNYTRGDDATVIARYRGSEGDPNTADPASAFELLVVPQPFRNHNGGHLEFGPDGYLYAALGDGGSAGDPAGHGQNAGTLLGAILRLDVDAPAPYVPPGNPFPEGSAPQIWAYGLRNPWRFSFDPLTGDLYIGDVGQNQWEEIDFLPGGHSGGANFGWSYREAFQGFQGTPPGSAVLVDPVWAYSHPEGGCSVTGGVVYRGSALPAWNGIYLYGDFCTGLVWGLFRDAAGAWQNLLLFQTGESITSFGVDERGEVYLVSRQGEIFQLVSR